MVATRHNMEVMNYSNLIDDIILTYKDNPIDLLGIGAGESEYQYLQNLKYSYTRTIKDVVPLLKKNAKVLEIGSLFGVVSTALAQSGFSVTGTDIPEFHASVRLQALYSKHNIAFDKVNLHDYKLPYKDESFNMVIMCEVLEHLNFNPLPILKEINRVLKKDGFIYVAMPNQASIDNRLKLVTGRSIHDPVQYFFDQLDASKNIIVSRHWKEYTMAEAIEMVDKMGFDIVKNYYFSENGPAKARKENIIQSFFRLFFHLIPSLRLSLVVIGKKKEKSPVYNFRFTESVL
jgi:2-polyprenyl-3-methyl-5-hydroxy-6-metoxy-1,4-benzoquinol methylase